MDIFVFAICLLVCTTISLGQICRLRYPCRTCNIAFIRDRRDCSVYYVCYFGYPYRLFCDQGYVYSTKTRTCVPEGNKFDDCPDGVTTATTSPAHTARPTTQQQITRPVDVKPNPGQPSCGVTRSSRIVKGQAAAKGSWPWQVSLELNSGFSNFHYCGGVLINKQWVMTAGHCLYGKTANDFYVILGSNIKDHVTSDSEIRNIDKLFIHPYYAGGVGHPNDIGLIKMREPVVFKEGIAAPCMPNVGEQFLDRECYITGFGLTKGTGNDNVLNELKINVIENSVCSSLWEYIPISDSHICVGDGSSGACRGDSGGPLVCINADGRFVLAGITSFGSTSCSHLGFPNVYTRVSSHLQWVNSIIANNRN